MDHDYYDFINDNHGRIFDESISPTIEKEGGGARAEVKVNLKNTYIKKISNLLQQPVQEAPPAKPAKTGP